MKILPWEKVIIAYNSLYRKDYDHGEGNCFPLQKCNLIVRSSFFYVEIFLFDIFLVEDLMADGKKMLANQTKEAMSDKVHIYIAYFNLYFYPLIFTSI